MTKNLKGITKLLSVIIMLSTYFLMIMSGCSSSNDNVLGGISDDSSKESKLEDARIYINDRKYDKAISVLEPMNQDDPEVLRQLAAAYAGRSGFETTKLLDAISLYRDATDQGKTTLEIVAYMMLGNKVTITPEELEFVLDNLMHSISLYERYMVLDPDARGVITQLGFVSLSHFCYQLVELVSLYLDENGIHPGEIEFSEAGLKNVFDSHDFSLPSEAEELINDMEDDISRMVHATLVIIDLLGEPDTAMEEINGFLSKIDNGEGSGRDGVLTQEEIRYYFSQL